VCGRCLRASVDERGAGLAQVRGDGLVRIANGRFPRLERTFALRRGRRLRRPIPERRVRLDVRRGPSIEANVFADPPEDGREHEGQRHLRLLELLGDPWSLLIVRDLMFKGLDTYSGFLQAGEGIATNVLSDRLARLERAGLVTRRRQAGDRRRVRYRLTAKGMDLAPVLVELVLWSARHERTDAPAAVVKLPLGSPNSETT
jgi:DNA-binding HxlR family transcriptional regulator